MDPKLLVMSLVAIPLTLLISLTIVDNMARNSLTAFEGTAVNQTLDPAAVIGTPATYTSPQVCKEGSITFVGNTSHKCHPNICYNQTYAGFNEPFTIVDTNNATMKGTLYLTCTPYSSSGFSSYQSVYDQTIAGNKIGSMVPYIMIALAIITVLMTAFTVSKLV
jgi:hypothetical protein